LKLNSVDRTQLGDLLIALGTQIQISPES